KAIDNPASAEPERRGLQISLRRASTAATMPATARAGQGLEVALEVQDVPPPAASAASSEAPAAVRPSIQAEQVICDRPGVGPGDRFLLIVPLRLGETRAVAAIVDVLPAVDDEEHRTAVAKCEQDLQRWGQELSKRSAIATLAIAKEPGFAVALS